MNSAATSPNTTATGARRRRLAVGIVVSSLLIASLVIADLAIGGRPDPAALRAKATLLDGTWRFRTGDDPHWADPGIDESAWETIDMTAPPGSHDGDVGLPDYVAGWMAQGHPDHHGYAWYRRAVAVPAGSAAWAILGPTLVEDGYEIYWNGQLLGGSGRLGPDPRVVGTRPLEFALPADAAGTRGVLAVRAFMLARATPGGDGGGLHTAPILAPRPVADALHRAQWERTVAGYIVDAIEPIAMLAVIGLAIFCWPRTSRRGFLVCASVALALMAARRLNNAIVSWTDLMDLRTYSWLATWMWVPAVTAWTMAWNRWGGRPWRSIDAGAVALGILALVGAWAPSAGVTTASRIGSVALLAALAVGLLRERPVRLLPLVTMVTIVAALFGGELLDPIGVPGIWFPFGIGVSRTQYIYAIAIPLVALLFVHTMESADAGAPERASR